MLQIAKQTANVTSYVGNTFNNFALTAMSKSRGTSLTEKAENVKVFVRLRPLQCWETSSTISVISEKFIRIDKNRDSKVLQFNKVFDEGSTQLDIYKTIASPVVEQALNGYSGTIFAYGQSGTGKTFTILGDPNDPETRGIVPNVFSHILTQISLADSSTSYLVTVTLLEIYNEEVRDLLCNSNKKLEVRESPELGVYVKNLSGITVESMAQVSEIISKASRNRALGCTNLNSQSSRSHAVFSVLIESKHEDGSSFFGKLNLVDLAGSERVSKSYASGDRLKEAVKINLSLSVLGNVISALVDGNSTHIPYRNSKLTRLLQDSLGGNSLTSMIATISPSAKHFEETCYTLMYADRAKNIRNKIRKNEDTKSVLRSFEEKIRDLKNQLQGLEKIVPMRKKLTKQSDKALEDIKREKKDLEARLGALQRKILVGGENLLEKARLQLDLLESSHKELAMLDSSHQLLQETLESVKQEKNAFENKNLSLQEEDKLLDFEIEETEKKIANAQELLFSKESEYQNEISSLLYTNKSLAKEMGLANYVISKSIPSHQVEKIRDHMAWDEEAQEWRLNCIAHCGNNLKKITLDIGRGPKVKNSMKMRYRKYPPQA